MPDLLTCLLINLYAGQEARVLTRHGKMNWFQIGKGVRQGCILSPCLFHFYAEHIMQNARLHESEAGIKIARKNINNLRHSDDTTLMAESKEELKSLLMKEESEKAGSKLNIQKMKIMATGPISSIQSLSHVQLFEIPWTAACQAFLSITNSRRLLKLMSIELVMPFNHLILCRPLLFLPSLFPSIRVFFFH